MGAYLLRRLLLVIPTLWAIITINFFIVQIAPGGPVDQAIAAIELNIACIIVVGIILPVAYLTYPRQIPTINV